MAWHDPVVSAWERAGWWLEERLPQPVLRAWERLVFRARQLGRGVQTAVVTVLLFVLYGVGIGLTRLLVAVAARRHLQQYAMGPSKESYWLDAEGYELDERRLHGQI